MSRVLDWILDSVHDKILSISIWSTHFGNIEMITFHIDVERREVSIMCRCKLNRKSD